MLRDIDLGRRNVLRLGALTAARALTPGAIFSPSYGQEASAVDHTIRVAPLSLEIGPNTVIKTTGYDGSVPGPTLRFKEGRPVRIKVVNDSGYPNLVHWHGLYTPPLEDGAIEEGSALIAPGDSYTYDFAPKPAGTRWYHSHAMAMRDLNKSTFSGEFGFLLVEPAAGDPGAYDREVLLAARPWLGEWVSMQDIKKGPPPDNGLEVMYHAATLGDRMLGHGEPIRVREGERILFRVLNASPSMGVSLALPGHKFEVIALDGNPVPNPASLETLSLDVAERADVIVEMNNPGVWAFASTDDDDRKMGMGVVIEYAGRSGEPQWKKPADDWGYAKFALSAPAPQPDANFALKFEKIPGGRGGFNRWTINGKSWPKTNPLFALEPGKRTRLLLNNASGDEHPVHTHRHTFEVTKVGDLEMSKLMKDTIHLARYSTAEIDLFGDDPGESLLHCHHQDHMDEGFAGIITYR